jgi:ankyrin repeat protein
MVRLRIYNSADRGSNRWTALHLAAHRGDETVARRFIDKGADVKAKVRQQIGGATLSRSEKR